MPTHVSLRLKHPTMDLAGFAAELRLPSIRIWTAGDARMTPQGDPLRGVQQESYCALKIITSSGTITAAINVLRQAMANSARLRSDFFLPDLSKTLYCTLESDGEVLELTALNSLVDLNIRLEIAGCGGFSGTQFPRDQRPDLPIDGGTA